MAGKSEFKEKLGGILAFAKERELRVTTEEVEIYFEEDHLSEEQMDLVCDYLLAQNIAVKGYTKRSGTMTEVTEDAKELSKEEQEFLTEYLRDLSCVKSETLTDARMAYYMPKVTDEALLMQRGNAFLGDVVQEGNVALMLALSDSDNEMEDVVMECVRIGMQAFVKSQVEEGLRDRKMVERVAELDEAVTKLKENYGRDVAVEEVAEYLSVTQEEVKEVMKLAGEEVVGGEDDVADNL